MVMGGIEVNRERVNEFERSNWMQQVGSLTQMVSQLQAANEALQAAGAESAEEMAALNAHLAKSRYNVDALTTELDAANRQVGELQARLSEAHAEIDELNSPGLDVKSDGDTVKAEPVQAFGEARLRELGLAMPPEVPGLKANEVTPLDLKSHGVSDDELIKDADADKAGG